MKISAKSKEVIGVAAVMLGVVILQWSLWVSGKRMVSHDSIIWFGVFSYFFDCLRHGIMPLWNPYMNCGEVFFLNIHVLHLWDPSTLFLVFTGKFFRINSLTIYQYDLLLRYLIFISGSYIFFRRLAKYRFSAFFAFIALSFSALCSSYLKQHGFILCFYTLPWILFFSFKFLEEKKAMSFFWLSCFFGVAFSTSGYHSMYLVSSWLVLLACVYISKGLTFTKTGFSSNDRKVILGAVIIFILLSMNLIPVFLAYIRDTVPDVRIIEAPTAANAYPADFFNLFTPYSFMLHFEMLYFKSIHVSEAFLYIGLLPLFLAIVGLFYSRHKYRRGFIFALGITVLLMLGPKFGLLRLFHYFFPFFFIVRNTHIFATFFIFCLIYFTCIGTDVVLERIKNPGSERGLPKGWVSIVILISVTAILINRYVLAVYRAPLAQFPERYKAISLMLGGDFGSLLNNIFIRSYHNVFLFIASVLAVFFVFKSPNIKLKFKYFTLVLLVLVDLLFFNAALYRFTTIPKADLSLWPKEKVAYNDIRLPVMLPRYPFLGFAPAMQRIFSASSSKIPGITTHFYQMKDFFNFENNKVVPPETKEVFMGVTAERMKLVSGAVVLPLELQAREYAKLDEGATRRVVFIENDPPERFLKLKVPLEKIADIRIVKGTVKILGFDPNNMLVEVDPEADCVFYYSDGFDSSWRVFVDGKESEVYRANMAFKAVILEKGVHILRFTYDPWLYKITLFLYLAGLLLAAIILLSRSLFRKGVK
ncbi:MAG: hypothetical protein PHW98_06670 [Candidatus Omnitrophica bacterium]|nr:hypothetical protein [Candidatus Omnitrophota bacterium]